jgi:hypothetical protein
VGVLLGNEPALDPAALYRQCVEADPPLPTDVWFGKCNKFVHNLGEQPGTGGLLLSGATLDKLDLNTSYDLTFDDLTNPPVVFHQITVTSARCVTPGLRGDPAAAYYAEVADRRKLMAAVPIDRAYNRLSCDGTGYFAATLNSGSPWTWQQVVQNLATALGLGTVTLPFTPDGTPENLLFFGDYAWRALNVVARLVGCAVLYDPTDDEDGVSGVSVVQVGVADADADSVLDGLDALRVWDYEPRVLTLGNGVPAKVRVRFRRYPPPADGTTPFYYVEKDPPGTLTTATAPDSVVWLDDDLAARCDGSNAVTNGTALGTRATERAAEYYRALTGAGADPLLRVYAGVQLDAGPGAKVKAVVVQDTGGGYKTEVYRGRAVEPPGQEVPADCCCADNGGGLDRARVNSGTPTTVNSCDYSSGVLLKPGTHPGCNWADGIDIWVTPGDCTALVNGAEYWARKVTPVAVSGQTRPTYVALFRAECCDCGDAPEGDGWEAQTDLCALSFVQDQCADGVKTTTETVVCLPVPAKAIFVRETETALEADPTWVSYVGLMPPDGLLVTPASVTDAGTFVMTWDDVPAHYVRIGPTSGADAPPTSRLLEVADLPADADGTLAADSDSLIPTQKAVRTYASGLIAAADAMVFKGVIDCSANPNYPAADRGWTYRVSVAGKIGGSSGVVVEAGDVLICLDDGTASGNQATVGSHWTVAQANLDGAVIGPASATDGHLALFNGTTGKVIKDSTATAFLDAAFGSTQGGMLERGASAWGFVAPPAAAGKVFVSGGTGASGSWKTPGISGTPTFSGTFVCGTSGISGTISGLTIAFT